MATENKEGLFGNPGGKTILMCNEAIARGAIEAGVKVAAGYPGTPSSEIIENLGRAAGSAGMHVEWSTNEKVATEVASAASIAGVRALSTMKMVGLNVASDSLMTINLSGVNGGFVMVVADDPGAWVSQNEQDSRVYAKFANVPMLEPTSPQEAKDMVVRAYELSEQFQLPVLFRTCTRLAHSSGDVVLGGITNKEPVPFKKNFDRYYMGDTVTIARLEWLHGQMEKVKGLESEFSRTESKGGETLGVIACSMAYNYAREAIKRIGIEDEAAVLKIGMTHPLPEKMIKQFLGRFDRVFVAEESTPFIEDALKEYLYDLGKRVEIFGRRSGHIPAAGEMTTDSVAEGMAKALGMEYNPVSAEEAGLFEEIADITPSRSAFSFCAGCPHLGTFYALKKVLRKKGIKDYVNAGDIGCYQISMFPPLCVMDLGFDMGASIAQASGFFHAGYKGVIIGSIGDSTFFHAGIPPLINAVVNKVRGVFLICDNNITAMTGHQPHPGSGKTATGENTKKLDIAKMAKACGIDFVKITDAYDFRQTCNTLSKALDYKGPAVVIASRPCAELVVRAARKVGKQLKTYKVNEKKCIGCRICATQFGCMAITFDTAKKKAGVDPTLCMGCSLCAQICPSGAIRRG